MISTAIESTDRRHAVCRDSIESLERTVIGQGHVLRAADYMGSELESLIAEIRTHRQHHRNDCNCLEHLSLRAAEDALKDFRRRRG